MNREHLSSHYLCYAKLVEWGSLPYIKLEHSSTYIFYISKNPFFFYYILLIIICQCLNNCHAHHALWGRAFHFLWFRHTLIDWSIMTRNPNLNWIGIYSQTNNLSSYKKSIIFFLQSVEFESKKNKNYETEKLI